jgi:hypothetical protein
MVYSNALYHIGQSVFNNVNKSKLAHLDENKIINRSGQSVFLQFTY